MNDDQFKTLCAKIDNVANVIVIEGYVALTLALIFLATR